MKNTGQIFFELLYPFLKVHKREIRLDRDLKYLNVLSHCMLFFRFILIFLKDMIVISNDIVD
jgi:hypothetical protein